jgi:pyruvate carboxylase
MSIKQLLIANRGEVAIRIARAAAELGIQTVTIHSEDDANSLHTRAGDHALALKGSGPRAYLDIDQIVAAGKASGCDAVHPGYGFLSENAEFARRCRAAGLKFVGPSAEVLELFGDKAKSRSLAQSCRVPVLRGTQGSTSLAEVKSFFASQKDGAAIVVKAIAGGGGRGIRVVRSAAEIDEAYARCQSEARAAFGNGDVYVESFVSAARHIEVQVLGDGTTQSHLFERDCTIQRRQQKIIEIAPSPRLAPQLREKIIDAALRLAKEARLENLATFEFLVEGDPSSALASRAYGDRRDHRR